MALSSPRSVDRPHPRSSPGPDMQSASVCFFLFLMDFYTVHKSLDRSEGRGCRRLVIARALDAFFMERQRDVSIILQWAGGQAVGRHSFDDVGQPVLATPSPRPVHGPTRRWHRAPHLIFRFLAHDG